MQWTISRMKNDRRNNKYLVKRQKIEAYALK